MNFASEAEELTFLRAENAALNEALCVIAGAFPTKLILGRAGERLDDIIERARAATRR